VRSSDYRYDVFDRRIGKTVDLDGVGTQVAMTERYVYDGDHIALVFDGAGNQLQRFLYGTQVDQVLVQENGNGSLYWALSDHQGTVRDVVDSQGNVLNHIVYNSFGNVTSETNGGIDFRFGYTGRELDAETGLYYYRARYYDATTGQFIGQDPLSFGGGDANLYRYVFNGSINFTDPSGSLVIPAVLPWILIGAGVVGLGIVVHQATQPPSGTKVAPEAPQDSSTEEDLEKKKKDDNKKPQETPNVPVIPDVGNAPQETPALKPKPEGAKCEEQKNCEESPCQKKYPKWGRCEEIKGKQYRFGGFQYEKREDAIEAVKHLRKTRLSKIEKIKKTNLEDDLWAGSEDLAKKRPFIPIRKAPLFHINLYLRTEPGVSGGTLWRTKCCDDSSGTAKAYDAYAIDNIKGINEKTQKNTSWYDDKRGGLDERGNDRFTVWKATGNLTYLT
jgi:RHS repeat-associated protein